MVRDPAHNARDALESLAGGREDNRKLTGAACARAFLGPPMRAMGLAWHPFAGEGFVARCAATPERAGHGHVRASTSALSGCVGTWHAMSCSVRNIHYMPLAGIVAFMAMGVRPADTARRRDTMENFCRGASDLCVFTCGGAVSCPSLSDGYICESRHGSLVVIEDGETAYYEADYSLCWHYSREPDDPLPDPEHEPVPRWPGDGDRAMCLQCKREHNICDAFVDHGEDICVESFSRRYTRHCKGAFERGKRPTDRRGRPYQPKDRYCANVLDTEEALYSEYEDVGTDTHTRKRLLQARKRCEAKLVEECVAHFAEDLPGEDQGSRWGVDLEVKEFFGGVYEGSRTIHWGGNKGYLSGCRRAAEVANTVCVNERDKCDRKASPNKPCPL